MHDEKLIKELVQKHYDHPYYRKEVATEYQELTGIRLPQPTLRDMLVRWGMVRLDNAKEPKTFNQRTDEIIDEPRKLYTSEELLIAMGVDPNGDLEFDRATVNRWWLDSGDILERIRNGQLKVQLKKKKFELTEEVFRSLLTENVEPKEILPRPTQSHQGLFTIPLFDMHLGINTYEDYVDSQAGIYRYIQSQYWDENLYVIGQDLFHNDDFRGRTTKGTPIERVDINQAWHDALRFYCPLIEESLEHSQIVKVIYSRGNHDETLAWAFVQLLKHKYPNLVVDDDQREHKHHVYKGNFIGVTHGDKTQDNKLAQIFNSLFRVEMAQANTRIILRGHLHTNKMIDEYGTLIIGLGTKAKTDEWHLENGYVGNRKQFEVFIYDADKLHAHIYI